MDVLVDGDIPCPVNTVLRRANDPGSRRRPSRGGTGSGRTTDRGRLPERYALAWCQRIYSWLVQVQHAWAALGKSIHAGVEYHACGTILHAISYDTDTFPHHLNDPPVRHPRPLMRKTDRSHSPGLYHPLRFLVKHFPVSISTGARRSRSPEPMRTECRWSL